jgi:hypothetical protein
MRRRTVLRIALHFSKEQLVADNQTFIRAAYGVFWLAVGAYWLRLLAGRRGAQRRLEQLTQKEVAR